MKNANETSALSEDVQSHSRKDDSEHKIHREAVLYQPITSVELETLLSRVEQISTILRQNFFVVADLVDGRAFYLLNLETLTVVLRIHRLFYANARKSVQQIVAKVVSRILLS